MASKAEMHMQEVMKNTLCLIMDVPLKMKSVSLYLFILFTAFKLSLRTVGRVNPLIGETLNIICEVTGIAPDISPTWRSPSNNDILPLGNGK